MGAPRAEGVLAHGLGAAEVPPHACDGLIFYKHMLKVSEYNCWEKLEPFRDEWNALVEQSPTNEVFSTYEFLRAWDSSRTRKTALKIVAVRDGTHLAGIAPLMFTDKRRCGISMRSLEFIGTPNSDYSDFIYRDAAVLDVMWRHIRKTSTCADIVYLQQIKESSPTSAYLMADPLLTARPCAIGLSARLPPSASAPIEEYLKGPGLRKRTLRRIEKEGLVTLHFYEDAAAIRANLPVLFEHHIRRWRDTTTPSFFAEDAVRTLYMNWAEHLGKHVMLAVLALNGKPVATLFGFPYANKLIVHTVTYDVQYRQFHCGLVCIVRVMETLRSRGIEWVDFTRGTEGFKSFFADIPTLSYEFLQSQTLKGKCCTTAFFAAREFAASHRWAGRIATRFGLRADAVDRRLASLPPGGAERESKAEETTVA